MSSQLPDRNHKNKEKESFGEIVKSMNAFFSERPLKGILESIDEFFKNPFSQLSFPVDVSETRKEYIITAELPGIKKEQIHIDVLGNQVTISINNIEKITEEDDMNQVYRRRHSIQRSSRSIPLPIQINEKNVHASYRDGLLKIHIPKKIGNSIQID
jgi:HSP20 family protein